MKFLTLLEIDGLKGKNLYVYCYNNPVVLIDCNGERGQKIELGRGWYCRIDQENPSTGTKRHIHIWKGKRTYAQNDDGSPHDKNNNKSGPLDSKVQSAVLKKTGWDYNGKREEFFEKTEVTHNNNGSQYTYADGNTVYKNYSPYIIRVDSIDSYEGIYKSNSAISNFDYNGFYVSPLLEMSLTPFFSSYGFSGFYPFPATIF